MKRMLEKHFGKGWMALVYLFLFCLFRFVMRRDVGELGIADLMLLVVIADASQNAMSGGYTTITEGFILVATIIDLAHNLGLRTVAEGIERTAQLDRLRDMHCDLGQGFHVGRPMVAADVVDLLAVDDGRHRSTQSA